MRQSASVLHAPAAVGAAGPELSAEVEPEGSGTDGGGATVAALDVTPLRSSAGGDTFGSLQARGPNEANATENTGRAPRAARGTFVSSGAEGDRTPDLIHAMDALSQLSYGPEKLGWPSHYPGSPRL